MPGPQAWTVDPEDYTVEIDGGSSDIASIVATLKDDDGDADVDSNRATERAGRSRRSWLTVRQMRKSSTTMALTRS